MTSCRSTHIRLTCLLKNYFYNFFFNFLLKKNTCLSIHIRERYFLFEITPVIFDLNSLPHCVHMFLKCLNMLNADYSVELFKFDMWPLSRDIDSLWVDKFKMMNLITQYVFILNSDFNSMLYLCHWIWEEFGSINMKHIAKIIHLYNSSKIQ
jgi:hypothetical protein